MIKTDIIMCNDQRESWQIVDENVNDCLFDKTTEDILHIKFFLPFSYFILLIIH
jgi:hypothetical protein